jgi:dolichyl-phosphate beta-glucosyltransferase
MERCALVVPCFNEAERLDLPAFTAALEARPGLRFLFVDDGSRDATLEILRGFERRDPGRVAVLPLPENRGKAEAVRAGMARALADGDELVGFWDADMATPLDALDPFLTVLRDRPEVSVVFGARVQLLGRTIARSPLRHYLGRVFATAASLALSLPVYDTQCGAKLFRNGPETKALFAEPFLSRWIFDVEILARLVRARRLEGGRPVAESVYELPLDSWCDVRGSKVKPFDFVRAAGQLARIHARYLRGVRPRAAGAHAAQVRIDAGPAT